MTLTPGQTPVKPKTRVVRPPLPWPAAYLLDLALVVGFAALGRASHNDTVDLSGVLQTAWPFLIGATVGWVVAWRVYRRPPLSAHDGMLVWLLTVAVGMLVRVLAGGGTAVAFITVALVTTGVLMLGWRFVADYVVRRTH